MPDEESSKSPESAAPGKRPQARRSRRGGRGRGRGRKPATPAAAVTTEASTTEDAPPTIADEGMGLAEPPAEAMPMADSPIEEARHEAAEEFVREQSQQSQYLAERPERPYSERVERRDFKPAPPPAIADAIAEVNHIITSLKQVLDEMEEVLETLELAEVQKNADEREIQSLRNALRHVGRGGGESRHESHGHQSAPSARHEPRRGRR